MTILKISYIPIIVLYFFVGCDTKSSDYVNLVTEKSKPEQIKIVKKDNSNIEWTNQYGTKKYDEALAITAHMNGNIYTTGHTWGDLENNKNIGEYDIFVTQFDNSGKKLWTKLFGTPLGDQANAITNDEAGNIYITGSTSGQFKNNTHAGKEDVVVIKIDKQGERLWIKQYGSNSNDRANDIASDKNGNIYIAGYTEGSMPNNSNLGDTDMFISKFNSKGDLLWNRQIGTPSVDVAHAISIDENNNIYISGRTNGSINGYTNKGSYDIVVVKLDKDGKQIWIQQYGTNGLDFANAISSSDLESIYLTGFTSGSFEGNTNMGLNDIFISKLDNKGSIIWTNQYGTSEMEQANSITNIIDGHFYIAGKTAGNLDGNSKLGITDMFISKFHKNGKKLWTTQYGTPTLDKINGIFSDSNGETYIAGRTFGNYDIYKNKGRSDIIVQKLNNE